MTKFLYGQKKTYLVSNILYDIHDDHELSDLARTRPQSDKLNLIGNSIKLKGTGSIQCMDQTFNINPDRNKNLCEVE